jgi:hypothetical protein
MKVNDTVCIHYINISKNQFCQKNCCVADKRPLFVRKLRALIVIWYTLSPLDSSIGDRITGSDRLIRLGRFTSVSPNSKILNFSVIIV